MMINTGNARSAETQVQTQGQADLKNEGMPLASRTNMLSRIAGVAAMSVALASEPAVAQSPTNAPMSPNPATAPATPGYRVLTPEEVAAQVAPQTAAPAPAAPAPAAGPAIDPTKSNVTVLEKRPFCMDDEGNVLVVGNRRLQVRPGQTREGIPSKGECLRAIAEGVAHLKQMNGGGLPEGCNVKVVLYRAGGENKSIINPNVVPDIVNLSPTTFRAAMADPLTERAVMSLYEGTLLTVRNQGNSVTMTFKDRKDGQPVAIAVELEKR